MRLFKNNKLKTHIIQMMNEEVIQNTNTESKSIVEDNSVNEMEKSFCTRGYGN